MVLITKLHIYPELWIFSVSYLSYSFLLLNNIYKIYFLLALQFSTSKHETPSIALQTVDAVGSKHNNSLKVSHIFITRLRVSL